MYKMSWVKLLSEKRTDTIQKDYKSDNDQRDSFDMDFDIIVGLSNFRRLQDKAQVFPLEKGDFARSRLTHSLEVMAAAESLGKNAISIINKKYKEKLLKNADLKKIISQDLKVIENIPRVLKCAALIHDIGNPPFGHIGENIVSNWCSADIKKYNFPDDKSKNKLVIDGGMTLEQMYGTLDDQQKKDIKNFDGNAQLLRIFNKLGPSGRGISLSYAVLSTCIKYVNPSTAKTIGDRNSPTHYKKIGFFQSEQSFVRDIHSDVGTHFEKKYHRNPLAYLLEASDDISYLTSDLEDAVKKGIIEFSEIYEDLKKISIKKLEKNGIETIFTTCKNKTSVSFQGGYLEETIRKAMDNYQEIIEYFINTFEDSRSSKDVKISKMRKYLRGKLISQCSLVFEENYDSIMNGEFTTELLKKIQLVEITQYIRKQLIDKVYNCRMIAQTKVKVHKIMTTLLDYFIPAAFTVSVDKEFSKSENKDDLMRELMSPNYINSCIESIKKDGENESYHKIMLALDHISGMTDLYAVEVYEIISAVRNSLIS